MGFWYTDRRKGGSRGEGTRNPEGTLREPYRVLRSLDAVLKGFFRLTTRTLGSENLPF